MEKPKANTQRAKSTPTKAKAKTVKKPQQVKNQRVKKEVGTVKGKEKAPALDKNRHLLKEAMLVALAKTLGIVTPAARQVGIRRQQHYEWMQNDPLYKQAVDEMENEALDFAESKLHTLVAKGNVVATIFYLKTKGKKRGYIERTEINATNTNINHDAKPLTPDEIKAMADELDKNV